MTEETKTTPTTTKTKRERKGPSKPRVEPGEVEAARAAAQESLGQGGMIGFMDDGHCFAVSGGASIRSDDATSGSAARLAFFRGFLFRGKLEDQIAGGA